MTTTRPRAWRVAALAVCFGVTTLVALALAWSGEGTYAELVPGPVTFLLPAEPGPAQRAEAISRDTQLDWHRGWTAYVTGRRGDPPANLESGAFTAEERAHMDDVRRVFIGAQLAAAVGVLVGLWLAVAAWRSGALARLVRNGTVAAAIGVASVGAVAAVAFDAFFLTFHQVFFPQGNFLFPPGSNVLALYPTAYWYGITLRIGLSFLALAAAIAATAQVALRRSSSR